MSTEQEKRMEYAVKKLQDYMATYDKQANYKTYSDETFIDDVLYGLGLALGEVYRFGGGYGQFLRVLQKHIRERLK